MLDAGELPETERIKLLDLNVDRRTKQHIEILRCLGLVESVVTPVVGDRPVPLAPTVASRSVCNDCIVTADCTDHVCRLRADCHSPPACGVLSAQSAQSLQAVSADCSVASG